jgi:hypothetical protein
MILVLGVWAFVRALLVNSAASSRENVAHGINWRCCNDQAAAPASAGRTASSGSASHGSGRTGARA